MIPHTLGSRTRGGCSPQSKDALDESNVRGIQTTRSPGAFRLRPTSGDAFGVDVRELDLLTDRGDNTDINE